ncbi:MAG TPA: methyl-accepting chemotaxis protein, partial [Treponema sp.]|nr:methyl-accepting chemotaxis protein [Treponema sp.]
MGENASSNTEKRKSLVFRLVLFVGISIVCFNALQIIVTGEITKKSQLEDSANDYGVVAAAYSQVISEKINSYFYAMNFYVNSDMALEGTFDQMRQWLVSQEDHRISEFDYIMLAGSDGIAYTDTGKRIDISDRPYFKAIMQDGKTKFIDDPVVSRTTGQSVIHVTRAIVRNGKNIGLISGVMQSKNLGEIISNIKVGNTGYAFVLADDGTVISHPNRDWINKRNFLTGYSEGHEDMGELAKRMVSRETGHAWLKGIYDELEFISFTPVGGTSWSMAVSIQQKEIYSTISSMMG